MGKASFCGRQWGLSLLIIVAGCSQPQPASSPKPETIVQAPSLDELLNRKDFGAAASELSRRAAASSEPQASRLRLEEALLATDLGNNPSLVAAATIDPDLQGLFDALKALARSDARTAARALHAVHTASFNAYERGLYLRTLGRAQLGNNEFSPAAVNLTLAEVYPLPPNRRAELTTAIWQALSGAGAAALKSQIKPQAPNGAGWLALLDIADAASLQSPDFPARLADWQSTHPQHPAQTLLVDELLEQHEEFGTPSLAAPKRIALLLPFEGPLASAAAAIRDGFLAARFEMSSPQQMADVVTYDTAGRAISEVIDEAVADGAEFVVGPLDKQSVEVLKTRTNLPVPLLALNATEAPAQGRMPFYQFGLRPEDEVIDAADRAWREGRRRAVLIVPNTALGTRLLTAFNARWESLGGVVIATARFNRNVGSYEKTAQQVFGLSESQGRAAALRKLLRREIAFETQRRDDVDAVVMAALPVDARQILPQFRFFGADNVPVYATSMVYSGALDARADKDLDGVMFGESVWALEGRQDPLRAITSRYWKLPTAQDRFLGFGVDAWRMVSQLGALRGQPGKRVRGATGELSVDDKGFVRRNLVWARFVNGAPKLLD
ncbi:MAG: penicillin-binding protein activator [Gammaproteobacteria bacterium]|nr:penicillin-binding protein activator [Gammaproteobacteria bacterium]